ncbi:hypothetical protein, partial [Bosea massiliensis]
HTALQLRRSSLADAAPRARSIGGDRCSDAQIPHLIERGNCSSTHRSMNTSSFVDAVGQDIMLSFEIDE